MRWSYKTVHYELKKEGLLGSAFLDESEVELSLNQYGKAGWELVSIIETQDGLIAIFKQPLGLERQADPYTQEQEGRPVLHKREAGLPRGEGFVDKKVQEGRGVEATAVAIDEYEIVADEPIAEKEKSPKGDDDVGSIRIE